MLGKLRADSRTTLFFEGRLDMSGGHGSGGINLMPVMVRVLIGGLVVTLVPGLVRATYRAVVADYVDFDLSDFAFKFVADMNLWLAPLTIPFLGVWLAAFVILLFLRLM